MITAKKFKNLEDIFLQYIVKCIAEKIDLSGIDIPFKSCGLNT